MPDRIEITRREAFLSLGAGLLVSVFLEDADAQSPAARIHVGDDGIVTVLSGKVEEGQGARTEIAMAAAEELDIPLSKVRVVLADTARTPNDGITAGSRTTPGTIPAVRQAAAAARGALKNPAEWKLLGTPQWRTDAREVVTGRHIYPSDLTRPGMLYGTVLRAPAYGATLEAIDLAAAGQAVATRDGDFAACAAPTSFEARKAVEAIAATARWKTPAQSASNATLFSDLRAKARQRVEPLAGATHTATYHTAYVQHAPMEPRAAVAEWANGELTVWTGSSNPFAVRDSLAQAFSLPPEKVRVIVPDFGGGFGGKHTGEAALEAARLAKAAGKPVKVRWTRAEEFAHAYFRPAALIDVAATLKDGALEAWQFTNYNSGTAALEAPYRAGRKQEQYIPCEAPLRQGSYRALAATANNFAREAFLDELAAAAGMDPLDFRMKHLANDRIRAVLQAAAGRFGWAARRKAKRPANRGIGLACGTEKNSVVAACVEVEVDPKSGVPRLLEIVEAFECGAVLNPANTRAQVEGCILMGLGAALREEIEFEQGRLKNGRFSGYRVTRFHDVPPKMDILLLDRRNQPSAGAGETPILAVAPAMANAMHDATGKRVRALPLRAG